MRRTHGRGVTEGPELRPGPTTNQQLLRAEARGLPSDVHLTSHARDEVTLMPNRVARVLWVLVLALMGGWALGTDSPSAAGAPKAYVGLFKDDAVAVVDTAQNKVLGTIAVPKGPHGLVVTPDGRKVYVSSDGASTVSVIDTATDRVVTSIEVGANPHGLAVSGDGSRVLVLGWGSNRALIIDTATDRVSGQVSVAQPHNGTLSRDGRTGWVASQQQGATALVRLDLTAWKEEHASP